MVKKVSYLCFITLFATSLAFAGESDFVSESYIETEVPAKDMASGVTTITRSEIEALGIDKVVDIFRLVPGMSVTKMASSRDIVSYHGTNSILPRRTTVLVDGMSIHRVGTSELNWESFPVSVDDIERVEVYRNHVNPKSGAKTLQATINIITRHPSDVASGSVFVSKDTHGLDQQSLLIKNDIADTSFFIRAENIYNAGFNHSTINDASGNVTTANPIDGVQNKKLVVRSSSGISDSAELNVLAGVVDGDIEIDTHDSFATGPREENFKSAYINTALETKTDSDTLRVGGSLTTYDHIKEWHTCYPLAFFTDELRAMYDKNSVYANTLASGKIPKGGTSEDDALAVAFLTKVKSLGALATSKECGTVNENYNENRRVFNVENVHAFADLLIVTSGYEYQSNYYDSATISNGLIAVRSHNIHSTAHWQVKDSLGFSAGGNYYDVTIRDNSVGKFSYQAGLNYDYTNNQTAKFVFSKTHRTPEALELYLNWSYYMADFSIPFDDKTGGKFYRTTKSSGAPLEAENYQTYEVDFNGFLLNKAIEYDVKLFREEMKNLISQDLIFTNYNLNNDSETTLTGGEASVKYKINQMIGIVAGGSATDNDSSNVNERSLNLDNAGYISIMYNSEKTVGALSYFASSGIFNKSFSRIEFNCKRNFEILGTKSFAQATIQYQPSDYVSSEGKINAAGTGRDGSVEFIGYDNKYSARLGIGVIF